MEQRDLRRQIKVAKWSLIITFLLALAGIAVSWLCYNKSSKDLEDTKSELIETINALETKFDSSEEINSPNVEVIENQETPKFQEQKLWEGLYFISTDNPLRPYSPSSLINNREIFTPLKWTAGDIEAGEGQ